jgi:hypothetical protein
MEKRANRKPDLGPIGVSSLSISSLTAQPQGGQQDHGIAGAESRHRSH